MMNKNFEFILHADGVSLKEANKKPGTSYYELMSNSYSDNASSTYVNPTTE